MLRTFRSWMKDDRATAAIEAGLLFPVLVLILCGTIDVGMGCLINQKTINATQMISDLLSRDDSVSTADINDAIVAGQLAFAPFTTTSYGTDIAGVQFIGASLTPTVEWRVTTNMQPNTTITTKTIGLGLQNEGVLAVTVTYTYYPLFTAYMVSPFVMTEESYARSRKGVFIQKIG